MENTDIDFSTYDTFVKTSGVEKNENSLAWYKVHCKENEKWVSRKELLEILGVGKTALDRAINELKSSTNIDVSIDVSIKKGGYRNRETFYKEDLIKLIQDQLVKNRIHQGWSNGYTISVLESKDEKWISRKELLGILGVTEPTLDRAINELKSSTNIDVSTDEVIKKGGYNNSETFYREDLVKLIQLQLIKNQTHQGRANEVITEVVDSAVKEKLTASKAEDIKLAELNLAIEKEKSIQQENRAIAEKEISKQMRMLLKNENLKKDLDKLRTAAIGMSHYGNTETAKVYIGVNVGHPSDYKIGHASNMSRRGLIGSTDNPDLKYLYVKDVGSKGAAESLENTIHEELKDHNLKNYRPDIKSTEWFVLTPEELAVVVRKYDFLAYEPNRE